MENIYSEFAYFYDLLMDDFDYDTLHGIIRNELSAVKGKKLLDLACGTGEMSVRLYKDGYNVDAVDISEDMLSVAIEKAVESGAKINFMQQDITALSMNRTYDIVTSFTDGFNYITNIDKLRKTLESLYNNVLNEDGMLFFDLSSKHKLKNTLANNVYVEQREEVSYIWENFYDEENDLLTFEFTLFVKDDETGLFERSVESHEQAAYDDKTIVKLLEDIGYKSVKCYGDTDSLETSQRHYFTARR